MIYYRIIYTYKQVDVSVRNKTLQVIMFSHLTEVRKWEEYETQED